MDIFFDQKHNKNITCLVAFSHVPVLDYMSGCLLWDNRSSACLSLAYEVTGEGINSSSHVCLYICLQLSDCRSLVPDPASDRRFLGCRLTYCGSSRSSSQVNIYASGRTHIAVLWLPQNLLLLLTCILQPKYTFATGIKAHIWVFVFLCSLRFLSLAPQVLWLSQPVLLDFSVWVADWQIAGPGLQGHRWTSMRHAEHILQSSDYHRISCYC